MSRESRKDDTGHEDFITYLHSIIRGKYSVETPEERLAFRVAVSLIDAAHSYVDWLARTFNEGDENEVLDAITRLRDGEEELKSVLCGRARLAVAKRVNPGAPKRADIIGDDFILKHYLLDVFEELKSLASSHTGNPEGLAMEVCKRLGDRNSALHAASMVINLTLSYVNLPSPLASFIASAFEGWIKSAGEPSLLELGRPRLYMLSYPLYTLRWPPRWAEESRWIASAMKRPVDVRYASRCLVALRELHKALGGFEGSSDASESLSYTEALLLACLLSRYAAPREVPRLLDGAVRAVYGVGLREYLRGLSGRGNGRGELLRRLAALSPLAGFGVEAYAYGLGLLEPAAIYAAGADLDNLAFAAEAFVEAGVDAGFVERLLANAYLYSKPDIVVKVGLFVRLHGWPKAREAIREALGAPYP